MHEIRLSKRGLLSKIKVTYVEGSETASKVNYEAQFFRISCRIQTMFHDQNGNYNHESEIVRKDIINI